MECLDLKRIRALQLRPDLSKHVLRFGLVFLKDDYEQVCGVEAEMARVLGEGYL